MRYAKRLLQVCVLAGLGLYADKSAAAACYTCHDWYMETYQRAQEICASYGSYFMSQGDCYCFENEGGVYMAECQYFCLF